jgi:uncharacterized protein YbjQ (UPF0145 family)
MIRITTALLIGFFALAPATQARETRQELSFQELVNSEQARAAGIDGSVRFYLAGQKANVVSRLGEGVSNRKTNSANKTDEEACRWAALSALRAFQDSARDRGANAVVDIVSWYKKREFRSSSNYECFAGTFVTGVTLKGTYAKVN